ncbi:MAG: hypothetical protein RLZZ601_2037 [Pseudomonadota bacterium]|jgi:hypothetical protein
MYDYCYKTKMQLKPIMLDDEKKKLIEFEEEYRQKVAEKIRTKMDFVEKNAADLEKSFWTKASEVLNSNFGLWFLSSVFITGGAALYQNTQHHYEAKLNTEKEVITCEFEIANRLNSMKFLLLKAKTIGDAQTALTPISKSFGAVSAEYEHVNIAVLYFKIFQLTGIRDKQMGDLVKELEEINLAVQSANPKDPFIEADRKRLIEIISILQRYENQQINSRQN